MDVERLRLDFPLYSSDERDLIYLDSACQTLRPRQVIEAMNEYYLEYPACGGRSVHRLATKVSIKIEEAREMVAEFIGCSDPSCIVFTKNCTEALNLVAKGYPFQRGSAVLTTDMEHNSNHVPWLQLRELGIVRHRVVRTPPSGLFDLEAYRDAVAADVSMVSMVHTNNVTGTSLPAKEVVEMAHEREALVMLDGAQSAPHQRIDVEELDVDLFTFSAHKMLGPSGVGVLYGKRPVLERIEPLVSGGGAVGMTDYEKVEFLPPPERFEAGLLNYSGIIGTGAAVEYLGAVGMDEVADHEASLNRQATEGLQDIDAISLLGPPDPALRAGLLPFNIRGMTSHDVAMIIDEMAKVQIRSGMHCMHPYFRSRGIDGCARASFYLYNTAEECERFVSAVRAVADTFSS
ncbi:MAG: cysteine desulfurase [Methanomassiliicoccus sp.]|nr:cysteine desulfurase [Methanomassiliicoccus sp.]